MDNTHIILSVLLREYVHLQVGGNTIYNMLKLGDGETDINEKPRYPHKIIKTKVNSFNVPDELLISFFFLLVLNLYVYIT